VGGGMFRDWVVMVGVDLQKNKLPFPRT